MYQQTNKDDTPYKFQLLEPAVNKRLLSLFTGQTVGYAGYGPSKYIMPQKYRKIAEDIYNLEVRSDDVVVLTFPRCGTTWTQELVWLIQNNLDFETSKSINIVKRWTFIEHSSFLDPNTTNVYRKENENNEVALKAFEEFGNSLIPQLDRAPSPRFIKTHLPFSLLPPRLLDTTKVVYVVRDPRDVAISFYHHNRLIRTHNYVGDFKTYWELFLNDLILYSPYFAHLKEAWAKRNHPNILFLFYEDMVADFPAVIRRVAKFFDKDLTDDQVQSLYEYLKFDNFQKNPAVNFNTFTSMGITNKGEQPFIRKGKSGSWREEFDEEMTAQAQNWMDQHLKGTDIKLPFY